MTSLFERITPSELSLTATSRIFVAHLAVGTSLEDVIMAFEEFGRIEECTLIQKYQYHEIQVSAVIRFASIGQAVHAASVMDGVTADGLSLQVAIIPEGENAADTTLTSSQETSSTRCALITRISSVNARP
ncbi:hypothetical protein MJO28_015203 [Puccinia striiformis f. sp. tritici]|uniref:Uncharacterized protein n=1 Tax=Puccinia striiformis f. sp. tritici TaxID=168172 RepID=A0ACC0DRZ6_9BASI|nr:hypothetical protein MJO28_015203 [Puccinia striiformis f. sp. tritici]